MLIAAGTIYFHVDTIELRVFILLIYFVYSFKMIPINSYRDGGKSA